MARDSLARGLSPTPEEVEDALRNDLGTLAAELASERKRRRAAEADAAGWKKGVEDANRLTQEHAARADRLQAELDEERPAHAQFAADAYARIEKLERELDAAREREVLLREVLTESRGFVAAHVRAEEAELRGRLSKGARSALVHDRNDALQRLRDTLRETRPALLGAPAKEASGAR